jgi:hypothetical protein
VDADHGMSVQMAHEYILVTMRGVPLTEEGIYTFRLAPSRV